MFEILVPILLGFATVLFAFAQQAGDWLRAHAARRGRDIDFSVTSLKMLLPVSFYNGYFGAGVGVLMLGVMSVATGGDYRSANVAKNLVGGLNGIAAIAIFIAKGSVIWPQTLALMAGCIAGGVAGSWLARLVPRNAMRIAVVVIGALLTVVLRLALLVLEFLIAATCRAIPPRAWSWRCSASVSASTTVKWFLPANSS